VRRSVLAALFGAAACCGVLGITGPPGPGLDPDAMSYLGAAESVVRQGSLRVPMAAWSDADSTSPLGHFPPGFPLAVALPVALGAPTVQAARGVEAAAAAVTVGLVVWLVSAGGPAAGALAGAVVLATPGFALDHLRVLSEPLCLALLVATLVLMVRTRQPLAYGTTAAAAGLVRYGCASATAAVVLWELAGRGAPRSRLRRAALAAAPAALLQGLWVLRTELESGAVRSFGLRGNLGAAAREGGATLRAWLAPAARPSAAAALVALLVVAGAVGAVRAALRSRRAAVDGGGSGAAAAPAELGRVLDAALVLGGCYVAMVVFSRLFVDEGIPFDQRILSPLFLCAEVAVGAALAARWPRWNSAARTAVSMALGVWLVASAWGTARAVADGLDQGWGYAGEAWRGSGLGRWLRTEGRDAAVFSNNPAAVYFLTGRPSRDLPATLDADSVRQLGRVLAARRSLVVRLPSDLEPTAPPDSLARRLGLPMLGAFAEGAVWGPAPRRPAR
jgi:hypothetical protein